MRCVSRQDGRCIGRTYCGNVEIHGEKEALLDDVDGKQVETRINDHIRFLLDGWRRRRGRLDCQQQRGVDTFTSTHVYIKLQTG